MSTHPSTCCPSLWIQSTGDKAPDPWRDWRLLLLQLSIGGGGSRWAWTACLDPSHISALRPGDLRVGAPGGWVAPDISQLRLSSGAMPLALPSRELPLPLRDSSRPSASDETRSAELALALSAWALLVERAHGPAAARCLGSRGTWLATGRLEPGDGVDPSWSDQRVEAVRFVAEKLFAAALWAIESGLDRITFLVPEANFDEFTQRQLAGQERTALLGRLNRNLQPRDPEDPGRVLITRPQPAIDVKEVPGEAGRRVIVRISGPTGPAIEARSCTIHVVPVKSLGAAIEELAGRGTLERHPLEGYGPGAGRRPTGGAAAPVSGRSRALISALLLLLIAGSIAGVIGWIDPPTELVARPIDPPTDQEPPSLVDPLPTVEDEVQVTSPRRSRTRPPEAVPVPDPPPKCRRTSADVSGGELCRLLESSLEGQPGVSIHNGDALEAGSGRLRISQSMVLAIRGERCVVHSDFTGVSGFPAERLAEAAYALSRSCINAGSR